MLKHLLYLLSALVLLVSCKHEHNPFDNEFLTNTTVGVYGVSQTDYVYKPVDCQLSRTYDTRGNLTLRIMNCKEGSLCQVSGIRAEANKGDAFPVVILLNDALSSVDVEVLQADGNLLWLRSKDGSIGLIVKK